MEIEMIDDREYMPHWFYECEEQEENLALYSNLPPMNPEA